MWGFGQFHLTKILAADGQMRLPRARNLLSQISLREHGLHASRRPMRAVRLPSSKAVRAAIVASLRHGDATLDSTANALHVSGRTLQRHLERMGTSHSEMLAEVRMKIACRLLADSSKRLSDISDFLGYTNASSFSRSFTRLMKIQPVVYRQQQRAQQHDRALPRRRPRD
jgi:AraC-like DNA-binding protein